LKIHTLESLQTAVARTRTRRDTLPVSFVHCHGVFDVLHAGHLKYFEAAKKYGHSLIVTLTSDRYINKGPGRPYFDENTRAMMVAALEIVDFVAISDFPTGVQAIEILKPEFYVKGPDYKDPSKDVTGEIVNERLAVEKHGGKLVFTDEPVFSSSTLINRFFHNWSDEQRAQIERIKSFGGFEAVKRAIDELGKMRVFIVGEPIIDIYRFCSPEGISSKSPSISARFLYEEKYEGGSTAILNHLTGFCDFVIRFTGNTRNENIDKVPKKIRYISQDKSQRIFEVTEIDESIWSKEELANELPGLAEKYDAVIAADFGHGLFEGPMLDAMALVKPFVGLNVQTNSSNYGFNLIHKHKRFNYLCVDTREARLAAHDRFSVPIEVAEKIARLLGPGDLMGLTLGENGSVLLKKDSKYYNEQYRSPAFTDRVVDATGAGDAYFAITTVLLASGCKPELVPFIGNVFAGLKTKIIGNKESVSKAQLLKACEAILK
jgi:rfaE bifunctional protein nucleotidyltransferase chain/domain